MPEPFFVRTAAAADAPLILQMIREMAAAEQRQGEVSITRQSLDQHVFGPRPIAEVYLGFWEEEPVAYLMVQSRFSSYTGVPILYVEDVFVRPRSRGQGLGKTMMAFAAGLGLARGCGSLQWSVGDWNTPALLFYDRLETVREQGRVHYGLTGPALRKLAQEAPPLTQAAVGRY
jgi:GNAT superfamily N-acetyltransferase